jgi:hypothetical protein
MSPPIPIGVDDFRKIREEGLLYVDKTALIRELIDQPGVEVALLPRPRRFGKTVNLSMLRTWFEKRDEDLSPLFRDLSIWQAGDAYRPSAATARSWTAPPRPPSTNAPSSISRRGSTAATARRW